MKLQEAIKIIAQELNEMSREDFIKELEKHKDGDIAKALLEIANFERWALSHLTQRGQAKSCRFCDAEIWDKATGLCWYHQNNSPAV